MLQIIFPNSSDGQSEASWTMCHVPANGLLLISFIFAIQGPLLQSEVYWVLQFVFEMKRRSMIKLILIQYSVHTTLQLNWVTESQPFI